MRGGSSISYSLANQDTKQARHEKKNAQNSLPLAGERGCLCKPLVVKRAHEKADKREGDYDTTLLGKFPRRMRGGNRLSTVCVPCSRLLHLKPLRSEQPFLVHLIICSSGPVFLCLSIFSFPSPTWFRGCFFSSSSDQFLWERKFLPKSACFGLSTAFSPGKTARRETSPQNDLLDNTARISHTSTILGECSLTLAEKIQIPQPLHTAKRLEVNPITVTFANVQGLRDILFSAKTLTARTKLR